MKFTVSKTEIVETVSNIQRTVSSKTSIPALECVLLSADNGKLELCAYDLELGVTTEIPAQVEEAGKAALTAKTLSEIVRLAPGDEVTISVDDKNVAYIKSGAYENYMIATPAAEFPELPKISDTTVLNISSEVLKSMIRQTLFAVAESDAKPIHQGSQFRIENGVLDVVSVDGYRLAKRSEPVDFKEDISFVVPGKTLSEILKLIKGSDENIEVFAGSRYILFKIDSYTVISNLLDGEFLNYKAAIPPDFKTEVIAKTREVMDSVERVSLMITDRLKSPVRCTFAENEVEFKSATTMGSQKDKISAEINGESVEIGFNNRYLLDALKNTECDEIRIQLGGPLSPMKILPREGDSFLFLVLPVRLKND